MNVSVTLDSSVLFFAGSPVIANVSASGFPADSTMRRCYVRVSEANGSAFREYKWDADVNASGAHAKSVDISSAVRSLLADYDTLGKVQAAILENTKQAPSPIPLPILEFSVVAYVTYMLNGVTLGGFSSGGNGFQSGPVSSKAVHGALTDLERRNLTSASGLSRYPILLSRKPSDVEIVTDGQPYLETRILNSGAGPTLTSPSIGNISRSTYNVIYNTRVFLFRNTLGTPETVCATMLEQEDVNLKSEQYGRVSLPSFAPASRRIQQVSSHYVSYEMSSGNVSLAWARWWANEFLAAKEWWMLKDGKWIPVTIKSKSDTINIVSHSKADACHVDFTATVAINDDIDHPLF